MARPREPISLIEAKGKSHFSKVEIRERSDREVHGCTDEIVAPSYLTATQKKRFDKLADQLQKIKIMGETDCDTLARYVTAQDLYEQAVKNLRTVQNKLPKAGEPEEYATWALLLDSLDKRQDRYFKQASALARDLGLTISSRCKLQVPVKEESDKPVNKFAKFNVG